MIAYRYLYWACAFGHIFIAHFILKKTGVSPFMAKEEEGKTPFMVAIEHNKDNIVELLLAKDWIYPSDPKLIARQRQATDKFGNNPMHKACRFRNANMINMLLSEEIGALDQRNEFGKLPL
jgi:ankyrin repeat protein